jgi:hypothetical protein
LIRELCFLLGLPGSGINEIEYLHLFPSPPASMQDSAQHLAYGSPEVAWSSPRSLVSSSDRQNQELGWFFYLAEIALKRIAHNVIIWLYKAKATSHHGSTLESRDRYLQAGALEFETQIQEWYVRLKKRGAKLSDCCTGTELCHPR